MEKVNRNIRKIRLIKNLKQEHVAERLGISLKTYQKMENGEAPVSVERLNTIADVFEMQASDILNMPDDNQSFFITQNHNQSPVGVNNYIHAAEVEALKNHIQSLESSIRRLEENDRFQKELIAKLMAGKA